MPISEKITAMINDLRITEDEKNLMLEILEVEDRGVYRYTAEYEKIIKDFISLKEKEGVYK